MGNKVSRTMREKADLLCNGEQNTAVDAYCGSRAVWELLGDETFVSARNFPDAHPPKSFRGYFSGSQIIRIHEDDTLPQYMVVMKFGDAEYSFEMSRSKPDGDRVGSNTGRR